MYDLRKDRNSPETTSLYKNNIMKLHVVCATWYECTPYMSYVSDTKSHQNNNNNSNKINNVSTKNPRFPETQLFVTQFILSHARRTT